MVGEIQNVQRRQQKRRVLYFAIQPQPFFPANLKFESSLALFFFFHLSFTEPLGRSQSFSLSLHFLWTICKWVLDDRREFDPCFCRCNKICWKLGFFGGNLIRVLRGYELVRQLWQTRVQVRITG